MLKESFRYVQQMAKYTTEWDVSLTSIVKSLEAYSQRSGDDESF